MSPLSPPDPGAGFSVIRDRAGAVQAVVLPHDFGSLEQDWSVIDVVMSSPLPAVAVAG